MLPQTAADAVSTIPPHIPSNPGLLTLQVGISCDTQGAGGSGRIFSDLVRLLPSYGIDVAGVVHRPADIAQRSSGRICSFAPDERGPLRRLLAARSAIRAALLRTNPDLIVSHFAFYTLPVLDELRRRTLVVHFHGPWAAESSQEGASLLVARTKQVMERAVYSQARAVIVLSEAFARLLHQTYGVPAQRIQVIPGAVDIDRFALEVSREEARRQLGWPAGRRILLTVRRLVSRMGLENLIAAMSRVTEKHPDVLLCIAGKGRLRSSLEAQVSAAGLNQHVRFTGYLPEEQLPLAYRAAEANIVPTLALEGFGMVAVEALAAGTPSLVTPVGGLPETVTGLSSDLVFRSALPDDLAAGLDRFLSGSLHLPSGNECRAFARARFSLERMLRETAALYRDIATH